MERPPLLQSEPTSKSDNDRPKIIWKDDDSDWDRLYAVLKESNSDGQILEMWKHWIGTEPHQLGSKFRHRQWSEDDSYLPFELERDAKVQTNIDAGYTTERPAIECVIKVLHSHVCLTLKNLL